MHIGKTGRSLVEICRFCGWLFKQYRWYFSFPHMHPNMIKQSEILLRNVKSSYGWWNVPLRGTCNEIRPSLCEAEFHCEAISHRAAAFHPSVRTDFTDKKQHPFGCCFLSGGPEEIRTPDPYNANVVRSQLRYRPVWWMLCRPCSALRNICQLCYYTKSFLKCKGVIWNFNRRAVPDPAARKACGHFSRRGSRFCETVAKNSR